MERTAWWCSMEHVARGVHYGASLELERAHGARRGGIRAQRRATDPSGVASQSCLENCLERCTGRGGRVGVQHMLGGL